MATNVLEQDTFTRANQSGWGTASNGDTWTQDAGSATLSIASNEGTVTGNTTANRMYLGSTTSQAWEVLVRLETTFTPGTGIAGVIFKRTASNNYYAVHVISGSSLRLSKTISGTFTQLSTGTVTFTANNFYWIRARCVWNGTTNTFYARLWQDGNSEPSTWAISGTTDNAISSAGNAGVAATCATAGDTVKFDSFTATNASSIVSVSVRVPVSTQATKSVGLRTLIRTQKTLSTAIRVLVPIGTTVSTQVRTLVRSQATKSTPVRVGVRTLNTVSTPVRTLVRTSTTRSVPIRAVISTTQYALLSTVRRDGTGLRTDARDGTGLQTDVRDGTTLAASARDGTGLHTSARDGTGLSAHTRS